MDRQYRHFSSQLFTVRVWQEELGNDQTEWRGKVQHIASGDVRYFREWSMLVTILLEMLQEAEPDHEWISTFEMVK